MVTMMDILQCLGVEPATACSYTASLVNDAGKCHRLFAKLHASSSVVGAVTGKKPTFIEVYGRGKIVEASHNLRRNLNVEGLDALDIRTCKPDGSPWNFLLN